MRTVVKVVIIIIILAALSAVGTITPEPEPAGASSVATAHAIPVLPKTITVIPGNAAMKCQRTVCGAAHERNRGVIRVFIPQPTPIDQIVVTVNFSTKDPLNKGEVIKLGKGLTDTETETNTSSKPRLYAKFLVDIQEDPAQINELVDGRGFIYLWMARGSTKLSPKATVLIRP